jgi:hypothetical protein
MRHQHQRSIGGLDETTRSVRHLVPAAALLVVREFLNHPAAREAIRHGEVRQLAAEQLALHVAGEILAVAGLPGPGLANQWHQEFVSLHGMGV